MSVVVSSVADSLEGIILRLESAVRRRLGSDASIANVDVATLGASNRTLLFDLLDGNTTRRLVLRQETYRSPVSPFLSPHDQYCIHQVVHSHGLAIPEPIFELDETDELDRGFVVACIDGETLPKTLLGDSAFAPARSCFAAQSGEFFARLHAIPVAELPFLADSTDSIDPLNAQRQRYDSYQESHPGIEVGLRWLENNRPQRRAPKLIHGDYRVGNLLLDHQGITGVLDWECAHQGNAMEDIGWLCLRSWRFGRIDKPVGGMGPRSELYAAYSANGGETVDPEEVRWWEIFASLKWAILNIMQADGHVRGERRSLPFACCGRNAAMIEYDMLMTISGRFQ
ncbi:MAG: phosphotransferase family protein [Porticoccaceae bacterium]